MKLAPRFRDLDSGFALGPGADPVPVRVRRVSWLEVLMTLIAFGWLGGVIPFIAGILFAFLWGR